MPRIPQLPIAFMMIATVLGCSAADDVPDSGGEPPALPLARRAIEARSFALVNDNGDTLRFEVARTRDELRIARFRKTAGGRDSLVAIIDPDDYAPIRSFQRIHRDDGSITAEVHYGRGFDGQARLFITAPDGRRETNVRTPIPTLDAAQVPLTLGNLPLESGTVASFNFVAPFEESAIPARAEVGRARTIDLPSGPTDAIPVHFRVSGLEERFWFSVDPPHDLLRIEELTRGFVWSRL